MVTAGTVPKMVEIVREVVAQDRVAMRDKVHLKTWLRETGRGWLIFNSLDLVDALSWPAGVDTLQQIILAYSGHRSTIETGRSERILDPTLGTEVEVPVKKTDLLDVVELDACIRHLVAEIQKREPAWKLENPPL